MAANNPIDHILKQNLSEPKNSATTMSQTNSEIVANDSEKMIHSTHISVLNAGDEKQSSESKNNRDKKSSQLRELINSLPKNHHFLLISEFIDGRGDFLHVKSFLKEMRDENPSINIVGVFNLWASNVELCREFIQFIENHKKEFKELVISVDTKTIARVNDTPFDEMNNTYQKLVVDKLINPYKNSYKILPRLQNIVQMIQVSTSGLVFSGEPRIASWIQKEAQRTPFFQFDELGAKVGSHPMGVSDDSAGIRLIKAWKKRPDDVERAEALLSIPHPAFLQSLLNQKKPDVKAVFEYERNRKFFACDARGEMESTLFILMQIIAFKESVQGIDFHLSEKYLNPKVLHKLLLNLNIKPEDWCIVNDKDLEKIPEKIKVIRIFTISIPQNEDYNKLYYFENSVAGFSGDDGATTVFSSINIPVFLSFYHPIKQRFLLDVINTLHELELITAAEYLKQYIEFQNPLIVRVPSGRKVAASLSFNIANSRGKFSTLKDPDLEGTTTRDFQEIIVSTYAEHFGQYIKENFQSLQKEFEIFRSYVFENRDVFNTLNTLLENQVMTFLKKCKLPFTNDKHSVLTAYEMQLNGKSNTKANAIPANVHLRDSNLKSLMKAQLMILIPLGVPNSDKGKKGWGFAPSRDSFWLQGDRSILEHQIADCDAKLKKDQPTLKAIADFIKVDGSTDYCLFIKWEDLYRFLCESIPEFKQNSTQFKVQY